MMEFETQKARHNIYGLLSRILMQEADVALVDLIKNDEAVASFFPNFAQWPLIREMESAELVEKVLAVDYATTFFIYLIPYESFYTREDGMINSGGENPVAEFYSAYGFEIDLGKARSLSPDHIGIELEFMAVLVAKEIEALHNGDEAYATVIMEVQKRFLEEHLLRWAPMFLPALAEEAETPLYRDAAAVALDMILSDHEYLVGELA